MRAQRVPAGAASSTRAASLLATTHHRPPPGVRLGVGVVREPGVGAGGTGGGMGSEPESVQLRPVGGGSPAHSADHSPLGEGGGGGSDGGEYDPHVHRDLPNPTNNWETLVHLVKCSLGTGILAMPQAFARAGLATGALGTVVAGVLVTHCLHVLVRAQYAACRRRRVPLLSYPAAMAAALETGPPPLRPLARPSALAVDLFLVVYQLGICCVYIVFIADNIKKVVDPHYEMSVVAYMGMLLAPLVAFNLIPSLKMLAPFSALANALTLAGLAVVLYYLLAGDRPADRLGQPLDLWGSAATFPLFFGTILFALTAVGVVIALENNMATPKSFGTACGVLNSGMTLIVLLYVAVGALGYAYCGALCRDSITLDLPAGPLATSVIVMFVVAIFISYGLHCFVPVEVVWRGYVRPRLPPHATPAALRRAEIALRIALCLLTFVLAAAVPRLGLFISLFGALCLSALGICFPALMEACLSFPHKSARTRLVLLKDALLFVVGLVGLVAGTYTALKAIVLSFQPEALDLTSTPSPVPASPPPA